MALNKQERLLEIFFRGLRGESLRVSELANEYKVSEKSVSRYISELKDFLADHRELVGYTELQYDYRQKSYQLCLDGFLSNKELFALTELIIGTRAFSKIKLLELINKLEHFTTPTDRPRLREMICREMFHYSEVRHECESVDDVLWQLVCSITESKEISIEYYRLDQETVTHRVYPASVLFSDSYFYLIAFEIDDAEQTPKYFRVDRIRHITVHRKRLAPVDWPNFDEGLLRRRSLFMWASKLRTIRFEYSGRSVQAVLDRLPTAKIIEKRHDNTYLLEAEVYGDGIRMWLLSQGSWVKVVGPPEFVEEMRGEIQTMLNSYANDKEEGHERT
ncbi:WYL domain-containing protein [bacterium]|nr:WYL domain-containing protein [bacterium]